jgi:hypothetical protein
VVSRLIRERPRLVGDASAPGREVQLQRVDALEPELRGPDVREPVRAHQLIETVEQLRLIRTKLQRVSVGLEAGRIAG